MKVKALRGVCVGPEQHLAVGDTAELDEGTAGFLMSIDAVEPFVEKPTKKPKATETKSETAEEPAKVKE